MSSGVILAVGIIFGWISVIHCDPPPFVPCLLTCLGKSKVTEVEVNNAKNHCGLNTTCWRVQPNKIFAALGIKCLSQCLADPNRTPGPPVPTPPAYDACMSSCLHVNLDVFQNVYALCGGISPICFQLGFPGVNLELTYCDTYCRITTTSTTQPTTTITTGTTSKRNIITTTTTSKPSSTGDFKSCMITCLKASNNYNQVYSDIYGNDPESWESYKPYPLLCLIGCRMEIYLPAWEKEPDGVKNSFAQCMIGCSTAVAKKGSAEIFKSGCNNNLQCWDDHYGKNTHVCVISCRFDNYLPDAKNHHTVIIMNFLMRMSSCTGETIVQIRIKTNTCGFDLQLWFKIFGYSYFQCATRIMVEFWLPAYVVPKPAMKQLVIGCMAHGMGFSWEQANAGYSKCAFNWICWMDKFSIVELRVAIFCYLGSYPLDPLDSKPSQPVEIASCEFKTVNLACPVNQKVVILSVFYGRENAEFCIDGVPERYLKNIFCFGNAEKETAALANICDGHNTCRFHITNQIAGDPCKGTFKYTDAFYICK